MICVKRLTSNKRTKSDLSALWWRRSPGLSYSKTFNVTRLTIPTSQALVASEGDHIARAWSTVSDIGWYHIILLYLNSCIRYVLVLNPTWYITGWFKLSFHYQFVSSRSALLSPYSCIAFTVIGYGTKIVLPCHKVSILLYFLSSENCRSCSSWTKRTPKYCVCCAWGTIYMENLNIVNIRDRNNIIPIWIELMLNVWIMCRNVGTHSHRCKKSCRYPPV